MSDPVSIAATLLIKGFLNGFGTAAGRDAYYALKNAIISGYPEARQAIEEFELDPNSRELQMRLAAALRRLNADSDPNLQRLAKQLRHVIEYGVLPDPVDQLKRAIGFRQLQEILNMQLEHLIRIRASYRVDGADLLSSNISRATDVPSTVRAEVSALHEKIRKLIAHFALTIEGGKYGETEHLVKSLSARSMQERAVRLIEADKKLHVSYETLRLTVGFFGDFNVAVLDAIKQEPSVDRQMNMMFGNAIMLYELADYVIGFVENFTPEGLQDLEDLHRDALRRVETTREAQNRLSEQAKRDGIDPGVRDGILRDIKQRDEALSTFQEEWSRYIADAKQLYYPVTEVRGKIPNLEMIRENARIHIEVLEMVSMLSFLKESTTSIRATVDILKGFQLAPLDASRVRRLLEPRD
jgi:hypothetical protein